MTGDPFVEADWVAQRLDQLVLLDATYFMPANPEKSLEVFKEKHIPGARLFAVDEIADLSSPLPHMMPDPATFADAMGRLGVRGDSTVVVYDRSANHFSAPRVWFTLLANGHRNVRVLNGGLAAWEKAGLPVEQGFPEFEPTVYRSAQPGPAHVVTLEQVAKVVADGCTTAQIVDARSAPRFQGTVAEPRPGLRSGHMPGALNMPFDRLTGADGRFLDKPSIEHLFAEAGLKDGVPIITSCGSGLTAAVLALALARMGRTDVAIYDGSWMEWGARADTPVVASNPETLPGTAAAARVASR
jgi:thiosulfate/3-mercaptopyruvate sulfurtransferase